MGWKVRWMVLGAVILAGVALAIGRAAGGGVSAELGAGEARGVVVLGEGGWRGDEWNVPGEAFGGMRVVEEGGLRGVVWVDDGSRWVRWDERDLGVWFSAHEAYWYGQGRAEEIEREKLVPGDEVNGPVKIN